MLSRSTNKLLSSSSCFSVSKATAKNSPANHLQPHICRRCLHATIRKPPVPPPTPFVPDHATFLKLIGRSLSRFIPKFSSWEELFKLSSSDLRTRGIEPSRDRRYLLRWREKYRNGDFGIGGDMRFVQDGVGFMRVVELPRWKREEHATNATNATIAEREQGGSKAVEVAELISASLPLQKATATAAQYLSTNKIILNLPPDETDPTRVLEKGQSTFDLKKVQHVKLANGHMIQGPYVQPVKGSNGSVATLKVQEGLWEHRRGHKVDGGERRKAEVRFKRGVEERKKARV